MAALPEMLAVPAPEMVRAVPPGAVTLTVKALPAGAEPVARSRSKLTVSVAPSTSAHQKAGGGWAAATLSATEKSPPPLAFSPSIATQYSTPGSRPEIV